jgi:hypothetical protein
MGDRHIRCAAADVDGRNAQRVPAGTRLRLTVRAGKGGEEGFRLAAKWEMASLYSQTS